MSHSESITARQEANRLRIMRTGFRLFVKRTIDGVTLEEVAKASGIGAATLYRYFGGKTDLVIAISVWKWEEFWKAYVRQEGGQPGMTAAQRFAFYLGSFTDLYRNHKDLLRFNQFFNVYLQGIKADPKGTAPYSAMISGIAERFRGIWEDGRRDGTVRTEVSWQKVFSATLHIMLAAATRYAVGLMYRPEEGGEPEEELIMLRDMLYRQYTKG